MYTDSRAFQISPENKSYEEVLLDDLIALKFEINKPHNLKKLGLEIGGEIELYKKSRYDYTHVEIGFYGHNPYKVLSISKIEVENNSIDFLLRESMYFLEGEENVDYKDYNDEMREKYKDDEEKHKKHIVFFRKPLTFNFKRKKTKEEKTKTDSELQAMGLIIHNNDEVYEIIKCSEVQAKILFNCLVDEQVEILKKKIESDKIQRNEIEISEFIQVDFGFLRQKK